ncbi:MAG: hypothetical protein V4489_04565 [Chlamydiota bacterium]
MSSRDWMFRIQDILTAIEKLEDGRGLPLIRSTLEFLTLQKQA